MKKHAFLYLGISYSFPWVKILHFFYTDPGFGIEKFGSGIQDVIERSGPIILTNVSRRLKKHTDPGGSKNIRIQIRDVYTQSSVAVPNPGSVAFLTHGSGIWDG